MASQEHKDLADFLKNVHDSLRKSSLNIGVDKAWTEHCQNTKTLKKYASSMQKLATVYWDNNSNQCCKTVSRIKWAADFCYDYFKNSKYYYYRNKENDIAKKIELHIDIEENFVEPYKIIDIGSCYNPFKNFTFLDVFAIDLYPANDTVLQCDFLNVQFGSETLIKENNVIQIQECSFDIVSFCFVLEYIPSSSLRIEACKKAYRILKYGGLMIVVTPDSKHVGANSKIMKHWRYTLACMGFNRIRYEKLQHMHCMAFRKAAHIDTAKRWALLYKQDYMDGSINIPQDFQTSHEFNIILEDNDNNRDENDFINMPFLNIFIDND